MRQLGLIAITALLSAGAHATTMKALDLKALMTRADRVVLGTVVSEESHWTDAHDAIYTDALVKVERSYKGAVRPGDTVVVRREGGSVDGIGMRVFGTAELHPGDEAVLFLEPRGAATWVVGMAQGKWQVTVENGKKMVHADLSGIALLQQGTVALPGPRPLADVERQLKTMKLQLERNAK